jgi:nitrate/TMAO reductase-like tetraheme cytochrome c subunit
MIPPRESAGVGLRFIVLLQRVPDPESLDSPLPGGLARVVRFFLDFPQPLQIAGVVVGAIVAAAVAFVVWRRREQIWIWLKARPRMVYAWTAAVGVLVVVAGASVGMAGWNYVQHDNGFCTGCHVMEPAFVRFTESEHSQLECHDCHQQPITSSMWQLYLWVVERPEEIGEHAPVATDVCAACHIQDDPEEIWQAIAATQGHDLHLTSDSTALADVQCVTCHAPELHRFVPAEATCGQSGCHRLEDTRIALGEMAGDQTAFHCLSCHQFTVPLDPETAEGSGVMVPGIDACGSCHDMEPLVAEFAHGSDPHEAACGTCHNPHTQTEPDAAFETCSTAGCHSNPEQLSPFHGGLRAGVLEVCSTCHSAHLWVADGSDCRSCHEDVLRDGLP